MSTATVATLRRDIDAIRSRLAPDRPALSPLAVADRAGLAPDPWQRHLLQSEARQIIMLASRQSGKSTVTAVLAAQQAAYGPDTLTLLLSPSLRQSQELYRKVRHILAPLGEAAPPPAEESALRLELSNGARVVCLPGRESTVRGFSAPTLVIEDEASRVPDDLYMAIRPMLATSGGRLVLLSTPFGKRGHFHQEWAEGGPEWERFKVTADQCPRIDPGWLAKERATIGDWWFSQEFLCEFMEAEDQLFRDEDIAAAFDPNLMPLFPSEETQHVA